MSVPWTRKTRTSVLVSASFVLASWRHLRHSCDPDPRRARVGWPVPSSCAIHCSVCAPRPHPRSCPPSSLPRNEGLVGAPACGDVMKLQIRVDENGNIAESKFKTFGCGSAIASSSVATEWIKGKHVEDVLKIKNTDIANHLKLPPVKLHCSMLAEDAIKAAVHDWKEKQAKAGSEAA